MNSKAAATFGKTEREQKIRLFAAAFFFVLASAWTLYILWNPDILKITSGLSEQRSSMLGFQPTSDAEDRFRLILLGQIDLILSLYGLLRLSLVILGVSCFLIGVTIVESYAKTKALLESLKKT